jgi:eukaryotic-like serine/threonine-protein kinase
MNTERWRQISQLYNAALARDLAERSAFLRDACADDELRSEVESLLAQESPPESFLKPTPGLGTKKSEFDLNGQQIGIYRVVSLLGVGGMGEVYRARDTKLRRDVAIKVLPARFAADRDRLARFEREARLLATLNHPHIGAIYGFENAGPVSALVLELWPGGRACPRTGVMPTRRRP